MTQQLDRILMQDALALSQAACYASMAAKEHREGSEQSIAMLMMTQKLTAMTISALDAAVLPEIVAKPGEPTLEDYVNQAKAAAAAGQPVPEIVQTIDIPTPPPFPAPADAETAIADQSITLADSEYAPGVTNIIGDSEYKPLPVPMPAPAATVSLPSATELASATLDVASPVEPAPKAVSVSDEEMF